MNARFDATQAAWAELGIRPTADPAEIRSAYVQRLKAIDPDEDPQAFIALRQAVALAMHLVSQDRPSAADEAGGAPVGSAADSQPPGAVTNDGFERETDLATAPGAPGATELIPTPDPALFHAIEAILFGETGELDTRRLKMATMELLADPSLEHIRVMEAVENWLADVIVKATPRSDAMLAPAIAHFRWADRVEEWTTAPIVRWLVQRHIEARLIADRSVYGTVLSALRTTKGTPPPRLRRELDGIHRHWRSQDGIEAIFSPARREVSKQLGFCILMLPYIFVWSLLRPGYSAAARSLGFGWLALTLLAAMFTSAAPREPVAPSPVPPPFTLTYSEPATDLGPILSSISDSLELDTLRQSNPVLHDRLLARWRVARQRSEATNDFVAAVWAILDRSVEEGLRAGSPVLREQYWRLYADKLRWISDEAPQGGPIACDAFIRGSSGLSFPRDIESREDIVRTEALLTPPGPSQSARGASVHTFSVPDQIFYAARRDAGITEQDMTTALNNGGTEAQRCSVRIALIEAALARPSPATTRMLRDMLGAI